MKKIIFLLGRFYKNSYIFVVEAVCVASFLLVIGLFTGVIHLISKSSEMPSYFWVKYLSFALISALIAVAIRALFVWRVLKIADSKSFWLLEIAYEKALFPKGRLNVLEKMQWLNHDLLNEAKFNLSEAVKFESKMKAWKKFSIWLNRELLIAYCKAKSESVFEVIQEDDVKSKFVGIDVVLPILYLFLGRILDKCDTYEELRSRLQSIRDNTGAFNNERKYSSGIVKALIEETKNFTNPIAEPLLRAELESAKKGDKILKDRLKLIYLILDEAKSLGLKDLAFDAFYELFLQAPVYMAARSEITNKEDVVNNLYEVFESHRQN